MRQHRVEAATGQLLPVLITFPRTDSWNEITAISLALVLKITVNKIIDFYIVYARVLSSVEILI